MAKTIKSKSSNAVVEVAEEVADVVEIVDAAEVVDVPAVVVELDSDECLASKFTQLMDQISAMTIQFKEIQNNTKLMQKMYTKSLKQISKKSNKKNTKKPPSGFAKPTNLSDEICEFVNVEKGTMLARTEVTRNINAYIKEHNLQNPSDKRTILPDEKLRKIMNITEDNTDVITYFNLQRYIKHHFISVVPVVVTAEVAPDLHLDYSAAPAEPAV